jgi:hypothetical protein
VRHSRDGHIVLPFSVGRKLFLPFDVGAEVQLGRLAARDDSDRVDLGVIRTAALTDWARARTARRRLAVGVSSRWDVELDRRRRELVRHVVAPFSTAVASAFAESRDGLNAAELRLEGGMIWVSDAGWRPELAARASLERVWMAINDRPLSVYAELAYGSARDEASAEVGIRVGLFSADPRLRTRPRGVRRRVRSGRPGFAGLAETERSAPDR